MRSVEGTHHKTRVRYIAPPKVPSSPERKLNFSLIPKPLWKLNIRAFIKDSQWDNLREAIINARNPRCELCGKWEVEGLHAHEEWHYDTNGVPAIAHLVGIGIQCRLCHQAEHYGLTQMFYAEGHLSDEDLDEVHDHYCQINGVSREQMKADHEVECARWNALSRYPWDIDWGSFAVMLGERVESGDFNIQIEHKYGTLMAKPKTDHGPLPHVGLARPFGTRQDRHWAVPLVVARETNRINDACKVMGYIFITRGDVSDTIKADAEALVGQTYEHWRALPNDPLLFDLA